MSRPLSAAFRAALMAEQTSETAAVLLTISHPDLDETIRISTDASTCLSIDPLLYGTMSRGQAYNYIDFAISLPDDADGKPPGMDVQIGNIGHGIVRLVRSTSTPAAVTVEVISVDRPDMVEVELPDFDLVSASYDEDVVTLELAIDALATEPYPCDSFTPSGFGGLF